VRVRSIRAIDWIDDDDARLATVARGICQHHRDDRWFHATRAFTELSLTFSARVREEVPNGEGMRSWFLGHILVELLLDAVLLERQPNALIAYYAALDEIDVSVVECAVRRIAGRPANGLVRFISMFCRERFLCDYADDGKLLFRINQVMQRARLARLPGSFVNLLPEMRAAVRQRWAELLEGDSIATGATML
jgi:hypothetical protein